MALVQIFLLAASIRALLWLLEDLVGITAGFHPDSTYYVESARFLVEQRFDGWTSYTLNNEFFVVLSAVLFLIGDSVTFLRAINLLIGAAIPVVCFRLLSAIGCTKRTAWLGAAFAMLLPYQVHLSIHVLKDSAFILFGLVAAFGLIERRATLTLTMGALLILLRTYLGGVIFAVMVLFSMIRWRLFLAVSVLATALIVWSLLPWLSEQGQFLLERQELEIEGRELFADLQSSASRPNDYLSLFLFAVTSPVRQILIPSVLDARTFIDVAIAVHILFYQLLFAVTAVALVRRRRVIRRARKTRQGTFLVLACVVVFTVSCAFIDVVTPTIGPLVRYRELPFLLLSMACFVILDWSRRPARNPADRVLNAEFPFAQGRTWKDQTR